MVGPVHHEREAEPRPRGEHVAHRGPARLRAHGVGRQSRAVLVPVRRQVQEKHARAVRRRPPRRVARRPRGPAVPAPDDGDVEPEAAREGRHRRRVAERVRRVEHGWGDGAERVQDAPPGEQVADVRLSAGDQRIGQHVPRPRLEPPLLQRGCQLVAPLGPDREIVHQRDRLPVEQEPLQRGIHAGPNRSIEQLVDQRDEPLSEAPHGLVPLAVPVRVRHDEHVEA